MKKNIFNPESVLRKKNDFLFIFAGIFLLFVCGYFFFNSLSFLAKSVDDALSEDASVKNLPAFNIQGLKTLGILKSESSPMATTSTQPSPSASATSSPLESTP